MKMIAPNIAMPIVAPIALATLKTRRAEERERHDRLLGPALLPEEAREQQGAAGRRARRSTAEPQAYSTPPQLVSRISAPTPPESSVAPR